MEVVFSRECFWTENWGFITISSFWPPAPAPAFTPRAGAGGVKAGAGGVKAGAGAPAKGVKAADDPNSLLFEL